MLSSHLSSREKDGLYSALGGLSGWCWAWKLKAVTHCSSGLIANFLWIWERMHVFHHSQISQVEKIDFSIVGESFIELSKDLTAWSDRRKIKISLFPCVLSTDISKHILSYVFPLQGCMIDGRLKSLATMVILSSFLNWFWPFLKVTQYFPL